MPKLSDGTDISQMKVDQIEAAQRKADQEFFLDKRKLSPYFPTLADELNRRRRLGEAITARFLLAVFVAGLLYGFFVSPIGYGIALFGFVGFIVTCFVAGSRETKRALGK